MSEDTYQIVWIILNAVKNLQCGVDKLALFLKGSKSKLVVPIESNAARKYKLRGNKMCIGRFEKKKC